MKLTPEDIKLSRLINFQSECFSIVHCLSFWPEKAINDLRLKDRHPVIERIRKFIPKETPLSDCDDIIAALSFFAYNLKDLSKDPGGNQLRISAISALSSFNDEDLLGLDLSGFSDKEIESFNLLTAWADGNGTRNAVSKNATKSWMEDIIRNAPAIVVSSEWENRIKDFSIQCAKKKDSERERDNAGQYKRIFNGKIAELTTNIFYGLDPNEKLDLAIGDSKDFDEADLSGFPVEVGVKSVQRDDKNFWMIYPSENRKPNEWRRNCPLKTINEVRKRDPLKSGQWQILNTVERDFGSGSIIVRIISVVSPKQLSMRCDCTDYLMMDPNARFSKILSGTKCAYTGWSLFNGMTSKKYLKPTGKIESDFCEN